MSEMGENSQSCIKETQNGKHPFLFLNFFNLYVLLNIFNQYSNHEYKF